MASKLTPETHQKIVDAIRAGNFVTVAAHYAGITRSTFYDWMKQGKQAKTGKHHDFYVAVKQAESFAEVRAVAILQSEMKENWRAALSYLERKFPERWGTGCKKQSLMKTDQNKEETDEHVLFLRIAHYESVFTRLAEESENATEFAGGDTRGDRVGEPLDSDRPDTQTSGVPAAGAP